MHTDSSLLQTPTSLFSVRGLSELRADPRHLEFDDPQLEIDGYTAQLSWPSQGQFLEETQAVTFSWGRASVLTVVAHALIIFHRLFLSSRSHSLHWLAYSSQAHSQ